MREFLDKPDTRTKRPLVSFPLVVAFFQAMGGLMGWITAQGVDVWYQTLQKSPLNPPDFVFRLAWTALYFALSVSFWLLWERPESKERTYLLLFFVSHMFLNWAWSPLFFMLHALGASFVLILVMIFTAAMLAWLLWPQDRRAALLFIPYIGWLLFAGHLAHYIWKNN